MKRIKKLFFQAVRFGLVGVTNTLIDYVVTNLLVLLPLFARYYVLANVLGFLSGMVNSLILNKKWTFKQKEKMTGRQLICFLLINLLSLGVSSGVLLVTQERYALPFFLGKLLAVVASLGVNFVGNKLLVFKEQKPA